MSRKEIFDAIEAERAYQDGRWGHEFDDKNTPNDWAAYIGAYACKAAGIPGLTLDAAAYRTGLVKVAALAVAALESLERTGAPVKRHYD